MRTTMKSLILCTSLLATAMADHLSGFVAIMNADETKKTLDGNGNLISIEILAQGECKIGQDTVSFGAEVVYDYTDQQFFDGTINFLIEGGDIITAQFKAASISDELDSQGFFTITPSPLPGVVIGGKGAYKGATGTIDLFGRIMPGGHGPTFYNFDGEIDVINGRRLDSVDDVSKDKQVDAVTRRLGSPRG